MSYQQQAGGRWKNFDVGDVTQPCLWEKVAQDLPDGNPVPHF